MLRRLTAAQAREVRVRGRDQGDELVEQLDAGEHQTRAAVRQRAFHVPGEAAVGHLAQA